MWAETWMHISTWRIESSVCWRPADVSVSVLEPQLSKRIDYNAARPSYETRPILKGLTMMIVTSVSKYIDLYAVGFTQRNNTVSIASHEIYQSYSGYSIRLYGKIDDWHVDSSFTDYFF